VREQRACAECGGRFGHVYGCPEDDYEPTIDPAEEVDGIIVKGPIFGSVKRNNQINTMSNETTQPDIRSGIIATITAEEIASIMVRLLSEAKAQNVGITVIEIYAIDRNDTHGAYTNWAGHGIGGACKISQSSYSELVSALDAEIGASASTNK